MLSKEELKQIVHENEYKRVDILMLCAAINVDKPKSITEIKNTIIDAGFPEARLWNVSRDLKSKGSIRLIIKTKHGWEVTSNGRTHLKDVFGLNNGKKSSQVIPELRNLLPNLSDENTKIFLMEAIMCFEHNFYRASFVLSWVGAVALLQQFVVDTCLKQFNNEVVRRKKNSKYPWKPAKNIGDLSLLKEIELLEVLVKISKMSGAIKKELDKSLTLRNNCGHPNDFVIRELQTAAHLERLIDNVFMKYN